MAFEQASAQAITYPLGTTHCTECGRKATHWCGHVRRGSDKIIAGWCNYHSLCCDALRKLGYAGRWQPFMGCCELRD